MKKLINSNLFKQISDIIMITMALILIISVIGFVLPVNIEVIIVPLSFVLALLIYYFVNKRIIDTKQFLVAAIIIVAVTVIMCIVCSYIYSSDGDGNYYHKVGVGAIANGWNPFKESVQDFSSRFFAVDNIDFNAIWVDHYGKASWMIAGAIYALTGSIECGKVYNVLGMIVLFGQVVPLLEKVGINKILVYVFSVLIVFNPISNVQIFTYYVDGFLFSLTVALMISLIELVREASDNKINVYLFIMSCMIVLGNIKFTGLMYGGILCVIYYVYYFVVQYRGKKRIAIKEGGYFVGVAVVTIGVAGAPTYVQNFIEHGHPFYPLMGEGAVDIMGLNSPGGFLDHSIIYKLFYSIFGRIDNFCIMMGGDKLLPELKLPFTFNMEELSRFGDIAPDSRISGMGIFFSGLIICSTILGVFYIVKNRKVLKSVMPLIIINVAFTIFMMIILSESWWARYVPFMYVFMIAGFIITARFASRGIIKGIYGILIIVLAVNNAMFFANLRNFYSGSKEIRDTVSSLQDKTIKVTRVDYPGCLYLLEDTHINYSIDESLIAQSDDVSSLAQQDDNKTTAGEQGIYYNNLGYKQEDR